MFKNVNNKALDDLNCSILKELGENARISTTEIGRRVGLSAPAVADRIQKLEEQGYIKGYNTSIDFDKIGLTIQAFISFKSTSFISLPSVTALNLHMTPIRSCLNALKERSGNAKLFSD